ncbi:hypothetical protein [Thiolapillus sp.]
MNIFSEQLLAGNCNSRPFVAPASKMPLSSCCPDLPPCTISARSAMVENSGSRFDPEVVQAFQTVVEDFRDIAQRFSDQ